MEMMADIGRGDVLDDVSRWPHAASLSEGEAMPRLQHPIPLGYASAATEVRTIAAPLLTAAALSLAGVVAGVDEKTFRWPGPTLLLLVTTSLLLVASLQLHYYARQYLYSRADIDDWMSVNIATEQPEIYNRLCAWQGDDYNRWAKFNNAAIHCFNVGTVLLGFAVSVALAPPDTWKEAGWRWAAAGLVFVSVIADLVWTLSQYHSSGRLQQERDKELGNIPIKP